MTLIKISQKVNLYPKMIIVLLITILQHLFNINININKILIIIIIIFNIKCNNNNSNQTNHNNNLKFVILTNKINFKHNELHKEFKIHNNSTNYKDWAVAGDGASHRSRRATGATRILCARVDD